MRTLIGVTLAGDMSCVCEEVAICYLLVATRPPEAFLHVEFDEQFESEVCMTLASMVQKKYASLHRCLTGWWTCCSSEEVVAIRNRLVATCRDPKLFYTYNLMSNSNLKSA